MLTKASAITSEVRTDPRAEVGERAGSTRGSASTITIVGLACLILAGTGRAQGVVAWGTTATASATCRRFRPGSPTSRSRRAMVTRWRAGATAPSSRGGTTATASATCRRFRPGSPTSRSRRAAHHTVARRSDGSVVAWGDNDFGQCNVPALPAGLTYVEVAAGGCSHGGAPERRLRRRVGGQRLRPVQRAGASGRAHLRRGRGGRLSHGGAPERRLRRRVGVQRLRPVQRSGASGRAHLRRGRGGRCSHGGAPERRLRRRVGGQLLRPVQRAGAPGGLTYVEIAAGGGHTVARRSDGSVVAWGDNVYGQCNVPALPAGLTYVEVAAGGYHTVARYDLAAAVVSVGTGCGGAGMPVFGCNAPRIGQNVTFSLTQGTPNASGFLYGSGVPAAPIALGSGCTVEVDLATFSPLLPVVANAAGAWAVTVAIPLGSEPGGRLSGRAADRAVRHAGPVGLRPEQRADRHGRVLIQAGRHHPGWLRPGCRPAVVHPRSGWPHRHRPGFRSFGTIPRQTRR